MAHYLELGYFGPVAFDVRLSVDDVRYLPLASRHISANTNIDTFSHNARCADTQISSISAVDRSPQVPE